MRVKDLSEAPRAKKPPKPKNSANFGPGRAPNGKFQKIAKASSAISKPSATKTKSQPTPVKGLDYRNLIKHLLSIGATEKEIYKTTGWKPDQYQNLLSKPEPTPQPEPPPQPEPQPQAQPSVSYQHKAVPLKHVGGVDLDARSKKMRKMQLSIMNRYMNAKARDPELHIDKFLHQMFPTLDQEFFNRMKQPKTPGQEKHYINAALDKVTRDTGYFSR
jgi:hypothetical protein